MKTQAGLRVRRRAAMSYSVAQPQFLKRKWMTPITWGILAVVVAAVIGVAALAFSGNAVNATYSMSYRTPTDADQKILDVTGEDRALSANRYASIPGSDVTGQGWDRMIIRTAVVDLTVKDVTTAIERVKAITAQQGGYVFSSESHEQGEYTYATVTVYVPAKEFDQIMPILRGLDGQVEKVTSENVTSSDVTEEYTDLQSQLRNLKATEARMLDLQSKAIALVDVLAVDRELRTVQGEIETIQGRINYLDKRTDMSTVTMNLSPVAAAPLKPQSTWQPLDAAGKAWDSSLEMLGNTATALITIAVFLWWLVPIVFVGTWITARLRRKPAVVPAEG
ncbi:MAG: DUF4349 domain-containing protein [Chloroflexia bacterium]